MFLKYLSESLDFTLRIEIAEETSYSAELELLDLASFASVGAFAARLRDVPIDILVANAAIATGQFSLTEDGWEQT